VPATTELLDAARRALLDDRRQLTLDGREVTLGDLQEMGMTAGINALIVGNYLTTLGRAPQEDLVMLDNLRMPVGTLSKVI
jgi:biotin synthase-like enzyme